MVTFASQAMRASASTAGEKRLAHDADGQVGKDFPGVAHENGPSVAMHKHRETLKVREAHDDAQVLGNVDGARRCDVIRSACPTVLPPGSQPSGRSLRKPF